MENSSSEAFLGVRFVLIGFNAIDEAKVRSKLVGGGGIDVGRYSQNCTHVIVDKITYDHPACNAAKKDGKILVTGLWVDHSLETGMAADASSVIYRPPRNLNGIPGAESLIVCLTGYQRQDREDIMTMVIMMGAQFSKPLVANKVTHLICYKFEGEKYDLAKRLRRIKIVNHRWLEDCLKDWKLLPEADYNKSGHELEMMEASAKDSEDDAEHASMKQSGVQLNRSPLGLRCDITDAAGTPGMGDLDAPPAQPTTSIMDDLPNFAASESTWVTPVKVNKPYKPPSFGDNKVTLQHTHSNALPDPLEKAPESGRVDHAVGSIFRSAGSHSLSAGKVVTPLNYSRTTPKGSSDMNFEGISIKLNSPMNIGLVGIAKSFQSPASKGKHAVGVIESVDVEACYKTKELQNEVSPRQPAQSSSISGSVLNSKAQKADSIGTTRVAQSSLSNYELQGKQTALLEGTTTNSVCNIVNWSDHGRHLPKSLESFSATEPPCSSKIPVANDIPVSRNLNPKVAQTEMANKNMSKLASNDLATEKSDAVMNLDSCQQSKDKPLSVQSGNKTVAKKTLGSRNRIKSTANKKGSVFSSKMSSNDGFEKVQEMVKRFGSEIDDACKRIDRLDDETESLAEKDDYDFDKLMNRNNLKEGELAHDASTEMEVKLGDKDVNFDSKQQKTNDAASLVDVLSENKDNQIATSGMLSPAKGTKRKPGVAGVETASVKKTNASKSKKEMKLKEKDNESKDQEDSSQGKEINRHNWGRRSSLDKPVNRDNLKEALMAHDAGTDMEAKLGDNDVIFDSKKDKTNDAASLDNMQNENKDNQMVSSGMLGPAKGRNRKLGVGRVETARFKKTKVSASKKDMKLKENENCCEARKMNKKQVTAGESKDQEDSSQEKENNRQDSGRGELLSMQKPINRDNLKGADMALDAVADMEPRLGDKDVILDSKEEKRNDAAGLIDVQSENKDNHMVSLGISSPAKGRKRKLGTARVAAASVKKTKASKSEKEMELKEKEKCSEARKLNRKQVRIGESKNQEDSSKDEENKRQDSGRGQRSSLEKQVNRDNLEEAEMAHDADTEMEAKLAGKDVNLDSKGEKTNDAAGLVDVQSENKDKQMVSPGMLSPAEGRKRRSSIETANVKTKTSKSKMERKLKERENGSEARKMNKKQVRTGKSQDQEDFSKEKENNRQDSGRGQHSSLKLAKEAVICTETAAVMKSKKIKAEPTVRKRSSGNDREDPKWFIFKGERKQRKEYQKIIKRLKGRCCRDSHQWSYQATHFISAELRRTEKFFAAAASGRWILKSHYVTASDQAGKLLPEEPYEWYEKGLGENGAINLEAPRKWRLLREKTGHGAFYGMCIVVYGDSFVPPLETLKRVVKAGDGTIFATSPPYTRFLDSDIHFAVVSPGTPHGDIWVQEFLKHEIPCVLADYLVEYVCKPGYELDKHVLYGMQPLAKRSFSKLKKLSNEVVDDYFLPANSSDTDDIACGVCGSRDRGDVMLICGDENGSTGCGIGIHIDCCNPPLHDVPDDDWYCSKCRASMNN